MLVFDGGEEAIVIKGASRPGPMSFGRFSGGFAGGGGRRGFFVIRIGRVGLLPADAGLGVLEPEGGGPGVVEGAGVGAVEVADGGPSW